jgi:hypothetical protein
MILGIAGLNSGPVEAFTTLTKVTKWNHTHCSNQMLVPLLMETERWKHGLGGDSADESRLHHTDIQMPGSRNNCLSVLRALVSYWGDLLHSILGTKTTRGLGIQTGTNAWQSSHQRLHNSGYHRGNNISCCVSQLEIRRWID